MCGIAGSISLAARQVSRAGLEAMVGAIAHRGPDGVGLWVSARGDVAFGHRRLAIIDLDPAANQPMHNEDGAVSIVFNGEIYNHKELRQALAAAGHRYATAGSDTESLIHGYEEWGIDGLLSRLQGIYSFAIHDSSRRITHLVRDPYGIKPLYVAWLDGEGGGALLFASEVKGILAHPEMRSGPALAHLAAYLTFMAVPAPYTFADGVFKLPAGHRLEVAEGAPQRLVRYYNPIAAATPVSGSRAEIVARLRGHVEQAVEDQMIADVPVGVMLSGGIDSTALLTLASQKHGPLDAYTVRFGDDDTFDETEAAAATAARCGARHHIYALPTRDAIDGIDAMVAAMDEPQADWVCLPLWFLSRDVSHRKGKVILVGEGADELFAGYGHWRMYLGSIAGHARKARLTGPLGVAAARLGRRFASHDLRALTRLDFLDRAAGGGEMFWGGAVLAWPMVGQALIGGHAALAGAEPRWIEADGGPSPAQGTDPEAMVSRWYASIDATRAGLHPLERMIGLEFLQRLPELLLMRVDKMTMAHGVEARVPFLDRRMVEFALGIPAEMKLEGAQPKGLLREALAGLLPQDLLTARKRGFGAPADRWLAGPFGDVARDTLRNGPLRDALDQTLIDRMLAEHRAGRHNHSGLLWALHGLSRWVTLNFGARA